MATIVVAFLVNDFLHPVYENFFDERFGVVLHCENRPSRDSYAWPKKWEVPQQKTKLDAQLTLFATALERFSQFQYLIVCAGDMVPVRSAQHIFDLITKSKKSFIPRTPLAMPSMVVHGDLYNVYLREQIKMLIFLLSDLPEPPRAPSKEGLPESWQLHTTLFDNELLGEDKNIDQSVVATMQGRSGQPRVFNDDDGNILVDFLMGQGENVLFVYPVTMAVPFLIESLATLEIELFPAPKPAPAKAKPAAAQASKKKSKAKSAAAASSEESSEESSESSESSESESSKPQAKTSKRNRAKASDSESSDVKLRKRRPVRSRAADANKEMYEVHFEEQDKALCALHSFNHVLQDHKFIWNPSKENVIFGRKTKKHIKGGDPLSPDTCINVKAICTTFVPDQSKDQAQAAWAEAVGDLIQPASKVKPTMTKFWKDSYKMIFGRLPDKATMAAGVRIETLDEMRDKFISKWLAKVMGDQFCSAYGDVPIGVLVKLAKMLNLRTATLFFADFENSEPLLALPQCLGCLQLFNKQKHWIAVVKYDQRCDLDQCAVYDSTHELQDPEPIKDFFKTNNFGADEQLRLFIFANAHSYESRAVKIWKAYGAVESQVPFMLDP